MHILKISIFVILLFLTSSSVYAVGHCLTEQVCFEFDKKGLTVPNGYILDTIKSVKQKSIFFTKYKGEIFYGPLVGRFSLSQLSDCKKLCDSSIQNIEGLSRESIFKNNSATAISWEVNSTQSPDWIGVIFTNDAVLTVFSDKVLWNNYIIDLGLKRTL